MNLQKTKKITLAILIVILVSYAFVSSLMLASAQTSATPSNWVNLITQTPNGAWSPKSGVTEYPWVCSPAANPERTGYTDSPGPNSNHVLWRKDISLHNWAFGVVANGTVYTLSMDQNALFALDAYTGETIWQYNLPLTDYPPSKYSIFGSWLNDNWVHLANNQVLTGRGDENKTMIIGAQSGALEWISPEGRVALIAPPGTVFANEYAVYLTLISEKRTICYKLAYDEQIKMTKVWESSSVADRLSYYQGKVYGTIHGSKWVSCAAADTGELLWNYTTNDPDREFYQHAAIADGKAYYPMSYANKIVVLDANTGNFLWDLVIDESDYFNNVAVANGKVFISGGTESRIYCIDAANGNRLWDFKPDGPSEYYHPTVAQDKVYFCSAAAPFEGYPMPGTFAGYMYCIDAKTGDLIWRYLTEEAPVNAWLADGNVYASVPFGHLWCWGKGPTTTTLAADSQGKVALYGSVTDMSPFSEQYPDLQSPLVSGVPVVLSYVKDGAWMDFATVNTASDGSYMYTWAPPSEGTYKIVARFEGNDAYGWSSAQVVINSGSSQITDYTWHFVGLGITIIAAIVVAALVLRKRK